MSTKGKKMRLSKLTAKKVALLGLFLALALIVGLLENLLPPIVPALPYAKLGLGNVVLLACFLLVGVWQGYVILVLRCLLMAVFSGNFASLIWSVPAALVAYTAMVFLAKPGFFSTTGVSVAGAMLHNAMQILVAAFVVGASVVVYLPYMLVAGFVAGFVTGIVCHFVVEGLKNKTKLPSAKGEEYFRTLETDEDENEVQTFIREQNVETADGNPSQSVENADGNQPQNEGSISGNQSQSESVSEETSQEE